jgi:hypothetical protein
MSQTSTAPLSRVRLDGPAAIAAALPLLVGFQPRESVVVIGVTGRRGRVELTLRVDLPPSGVAAPLAEVFAGHLRAAGATAALVAVVTEEPDDGAELPRSGLVEEFRAALGRARIDVRDVLCVRAGRWWSYVCAEPRCCPSGGTPVRPELAGVLAAAMVAEGRVVHADRADLVATLAPYPVADPAASARRFAAAGAEARRRLADPAGQRAAIEEIAAAVNRRVGRHAPVGQEQAVRFCVALARTEVRDACLRWLGTEAADAAEGLWLALLRAAPPPYAAAPATLLALHAYARGDGTLARIAADRALADEADHTLARMVHELLDRGVRPAEIAELGAWVEAAGGDA